MRRLKPLHQPGEPIPGDILARMTQPKVRDPLFQTVVVTRQPCRLNGRVLPAGTHLPVGPKMSKDAIETCCEAINRLVAEGRERFWANAHPVPQLAA